MSLLQRWKALPRQKRMIYLVLVVAVLFFFGDSEPEPETGKRKRKGQPVASASGSPESEATFESLSPQDRKRVQEWHAAAFDYYKNQEFDKALFEIDKVFTKVPDYLNSREIQRYAKEGKRKLDALAEEKRKKEEEARVKAKVAELVADAGQRMKRKEYEQARELFAQILALDPENAAVADWRKTLDEYDEQRRQAEQQKQILGEINERAMAVLREGLALKKRGRYYSAIDAFRRVPEMGATDPKILWRAKKEVARSKALIAALREPVLAEAKAAEGSGDLPKAFQLYRKATKLDPRHPAGYAGMERIRGVLHERAKAIYTEAVLAESYSDFDSARRKFKECQDTAPQDDIYHDRATRKLARYIRRDEPPAGGQ